MYFVLFSLSILGLIIQFRKNKAIFLLSFITLLIIFLSRSFSKTHSSRYYAIAIFWGIYLSAYCISCLKNTPLVVKSAIIVLIVILQTTKTFFSFNNKYLYDIKETIEHRLSPNYRLLIPKKDIARLTDYQEGNETKSFIIYEDSDFLRKYYDNFLFADNSYILLDAKLESSVKGHLDFETNSKSFKKIEQFCNNKKNNTISLYEQLPYFPSPQTDTLDYLFSPGCITLSKDTLYLARASLLQTESSSFVVKGNKSAIVLQKKIVISDKIVHTTATIKNIGEITANLLIGFSVYTKEHVKLDHRNFPYSHSNKVLKVISSAQGSNQMVVDSLSAWSKNCLMAIDVQDDLSDIPNNTFLEEKIVDMKPTDDGHAVLYLDKPLSKVLEEGTKIRVHGLPGSYLYTIKKTLLPGEEEEMKSTIQMASLLEFSPEGFPKGTFYINPIILSYSADSQNDNTIIIKDYTISY